jgi:hypothetical protein
VEDVNAWVISPVASHSTHDAALARPKAYSQGAFDGFALALLALRSAFLWPHSCGCAVQACAVEDEASGSQYS